MISAGVEGRLAYMTYTDPWSRNPPKQQPSEVFLRPAPKLPPPATRSIQEQTPIFPLYRSYNGVQTTTYPNGTRIAPPARACTYASPPPSGIPVNLTQPKDEIKEEPLPPYYRFVAHNPQYHPQFTYQSICPQQYLMRPQYPPTPLSPQNLFSPATPTASSTGTFLSPPATFSPTASSIAKPSSQGTILRGDKRTSPVTSTMVPGTVPHSPLPQSPSFKVPSGKEGSMKHRLLPRPEDTATARAIMPLDLQKSSSSSTTTSSSSEGGNNARKRLPASISPPQSPKKLFMSMLEPKPFRKGHIVNLGNGDQIRIEDMRTEDFVRSAESTNDLKIEECTVVKIDEGNDGYSFITLSYNQRKTQVEIKTISEHPYFLVGGGWASVKPDLTLQKCELNVHKLQVGDVVVSLLLRQPPASTTDSSRTSTILTTATTTAISSRQSSTNSSNSASSSTITTAPVNHYTPPIRSPHNHRPLSHSPPKSVQSPDYINATTMGGGATTYYQHGAQVAPLQLDAESRKRRWSAPDKIEEEQLPRRSRLE